MLDLSYLMYVQKFCVSLTGSLAAMTPSSHRQASARLEDLGMPRVRESCCDVGFIAAGTSAGELFTWQLRGGWCSERAFSGMLVSLPGSTSGPKCMHCSTYLACYLCMSIESVQGLSQSCTPATLCTSKWAEGVLLDGLQGTTFEPTSIIFESVGVTGSKWRCHSALYFA